MCNVYNECLQQQQHFYLYPAVNDYIKGSGTAPHLRAQLHKTFTQKKRAEKERQLKKANSIKQRKAILALSCTSDNLILYCFIR